MLGALKDMGLNPVWTCFFLEIKKFQRDPKYLSEYCLSAEFPQARNLPMVSDFFTIIQNFQSGYVASNSVKAAHCFQCFSAFRAAC